MSLEEIKSFMGHKLNLNEDIEDIKSFMGHKLYVNRDIEDAIPTIEVHQQIQNVMKQQDKMILQYCTTLKIDPDVLQKQLKEIQMLKMVIKQKDEQIEKMKCCENCKWNFVIGDYEPCNKCSDEKEKWELAE